MILVDTNVMSEPLRKVPAPRVAEWLDAQALETLYLSAITVAEVAFRCPCVAGGPPPRPPARGPGAAGIADVRRPGIGV